MTKHFNLQVTGKVQGVFFRASTQKMAGLLGVKGFVRNEPNGDVYIEAEADDEVLARFIQWCHHGPDNAKVTYVSVNEADWVGFEGFAINR